MFQPNLVTDNAGLTRMMFDAENGPDGSPRNRSVYTEKIVPLLWEPEAAEVDDDDDEEPAIPGGARHLCTFSMHHNRYEHRTQWMVRVKEATEGAEEMEPGAGIWMITIWLDVNPALLDETTWSVRQEQILQGADMTAEEQTAMLEGKLR